MSFLVFVYYTIELLLAFVHHLLFFLAMPRGSWDLSSLTRD